jgi:hypothetical protein
MARPTVIKIKKNGKWFMLGDEPPEKEPEPMPMPMRLPDPGAFDEPDTFLCEPAERCRCYFARLWRFMAMWYETKWVRAYISDMARVRRGLDAESREIARQILTQYGVA